MQNGFFLILQCKFINNNFINHATLKNPIDHCCVSSTVWVESLEDFKSVAKSPKTQFNIMWSIEKGCHFLFMTFWALDNFNLG